MAILLVPYYGIKAIILILLGNNHTFHLLALFLPARLLIVIYKI
jgi:hypothetical protein